MSEPFSSIDDPARIEAQMPWADRDVARSVYQLVRRARDRHGAAPAVSFQILSDPKSKAKTLTWHDLHDQVTQAANLFRSVGVGPGDVVACLLPNCHEALITQLGAAVAGVICPINPLLEPEQIAAILREVGAKVLVTLRPFPRSDVAQKAAEALRHTPDLHHLFEVDLAHYLSPPQRWLVPLLRPRRARHHAHRRDFATALAMQPTSLQFPDPPEDRIAACFHTGGTTGMPKVARHRVSGMIYNGWLGHTLLFTPDDVVMCPLPLFHVFAFQVIVMGALSSGAHMVLPTPAGYRGEGVFDNFWALLERWRVTFIITVPTAIAALMQRPVNADLSTVKIAFSGSSALPLELLRRFESTTGITLVEGYGLTEATCLVSCNPVSGQRKPGSVGFRFPYTDVRIMADVPGAAPRPCGVDEVGEICIASPGVAPGTIYATPAQNRDLFHPGGYLRTGDLGRIDGQGYLFITGRTKDVIVRGGHNIDPATIEDALSGHPEVALVGAIGQPDAYAGEIPCAYVELVAGGSASPEELHAYAARHVPERAAIPRHIEILPELPKTAVGKVFKPDLRRRAIARVYDQALATAGVDARVAEVIEDRQRGLIARLTGTSSDTEITQVLGSFTRPWERRG